MSTSGSHARAIGLCLRLLGGSASVTLVSTVAYASLVLAALGSEHPRRWATVSYGFTGAGAVLGALVLFSLSLYPALLQAVRASDATPPEVAPESARNLLYAAPRRAAAWVFLVGIGVLSAGYVPVAGRIAPERTIAAHIGAVAAGFGLLVLYAAIRTALRPLFEQLHNPLLSESELLAQRGALIDRIESRAATAIAVPAAVAALTVTLLVWSHKQIVADEDFARTRERVNVLLSMRPLEAEGPDVQLSVVEAVGREGVRVVETVDQATRTPSWKVDPEQRVVPQSMFWSLPVALVVLILAWQYGRRLGSEASNDIESAAKRLAVVGLQDIRQVTMGLVSPRSVPEIREMALCLDTLAATLLRMSEDQERAVSARKEASRVRSFVLASVSHDLRGPLNSVLGFAELLLSGAEGPLSAAQIESLDALVRGGRDLLRLVGDLLDHARIDAGRMSPRKTRAAVDVIVEHARSAAAERLRGTLRQEDIGLEGEGGLEILADEDLCANALGGLIAFAMLRPGSDRRVLVRVQGTPGHVRFIVRGGGTAPSRDALARLFEPFDFAPSGARAPAGLNLAVAVSRSIFALHGGTVTASPQDEGGIALSVDLPRPP